MATVLRGARGGAGAPRAGWPGRSQELLLQAALLADERGLTAWHEVRPQIELAQLDGAVIPLIPMLRENLALLGVDDSLLAVFKGVQRHTWAHNQMLLHAMMPRVAELERRGISTMLLKGAALIAAPGFDAGTRHMGDIDVLVPTDRAGAAIAALLGLGLAPFDGYPAWFVSDFAPLFNPSFPFADSDNLQLDLHWNVLHSSRQAGADDDFWAAARDIELCGVRTRALCDTDSLLHAVLHGLGANEPPGFRWVLDAALILRTGALLDYDRLVEQARRRRVVVILRAGLEYLRALIDAPIPVEVLSALASPRPRIVERIEFRAKLKRSRHWSRIERAVVYYQQYAHRHLPLGSRAGALRQRALIRQCFGLKHWWDLRSLSAGGRPGPSRPPARNTAPIGHDATQCATDPVRLDEPIEFNLADRVHALVRFGAWMPEHNGVWLAGREARLTLPLERAPSGPLLIGVHAENYLAHHLARSRLIVCVGAEHVGTLQIDATHGHLAGEHLYIPAALAAARQTLELTLKMPDATSPAELGISDDDRQLGLFLRELVLREPLVYELGSPLSFAADGNAAAALGRGWSHQEAGGRWSDGAIATLLLRLDDAAGPLELTLEADPFLGAPAKPLRVEILASGRRIGQFVYRPEEAGQSLSGRAVIPVECLRDNGELLLTLRIRDPRSPFALGLSRDQRRLGLFVRQLRLDAA